MTNAPRVHGVPANDSPLAYNEDELVAALTDIYQHFVQVSYLPENRVLFPPQDTGRHALNIDYLRDELHLDARVISLLECLPYISRKDFPECEWYPSAHVVNYLNPQDALRARDPLGLSVIGGGEEERVPNVDFMRPEDVTLSLPAHPSDHMFTLILDIAANSIRKLHSYCELPSFVDRTQLEVPEQKLHYRNHPAYHAPTFLREYYASLRSLEYFPAVGVYDIGHGPYDAWASISANILRRCFGWPDNFRRDAWREVVDRVSDEAWEAQERLEKSPDSQKQEGVYMEESLEKATAEVVAILGLNDSSAEAERRA